MALETLTLQIIAFSFAFWLGTYLIRRKPGDARLLWAGLGLIAYAFALGSNILSSQVNTAGTALILARILHSLLFLPSLFWFGAIVYLLPEELTAVRACLIRAWQYSLVPILILLVLQAAGSKWVFDLTAGSPGYFAAAGALVLHLFAALVLLVYIGYSFQPRKPLAVLVVATVMFGLGMGLLIYPLEWLPRNQVLIAMAADLAILGIVIGRLDALDEGEAFLPDFVRSLVSSAVGVVIFGGPVILTIALSTGLTFPLLILLLFTLMASIATQVYAEPVQLALDRVVFSRFPHIRRARADLRAAADALPRINDALDVTTMREIEFDRLTRRAISHLGDVSHLAASPLTHLPLVEARLAERGVPGDTLERAAELKAVLIESIVRLKPRGSSDFGVTGEWRHYNALYFPYVLGLKPYSQRTATDGIPPAAQKALAWFRTYVPERTLYNWQTAAARLVADDLRDRQTLRSQ